MDKNQSISKRVWNIVRFVLFMIRKGVSKGKLMADLNLMLKRGKNLMFHHRRRVPSTSTAAAATATAGRSSREYEFSCSNTPTYTFPFHLTSKNKKSHNIFFSCANEPDTLDDDGSTAAARAVLDLLNNNDGSGDQSGNAALTALSPYLPGFGRTPIVKPLRITDSPFPLREEGDDDNGHVDEAAEEFIKKFYKNLMQQKKTT